MKRTTMFTIGVLLALAAILGAAARHRSPTPAVLPVPANTLSFLPSPPTTPSLFDIIQGKRWLVFFQNPDELRPTGGFWGTIGDLQILADGHIHLSVKNVYDIDGPSEAFANTLPAPPIPLQRYLNADHWYLRDANWDPDFPMSAQRGLDYFAKETKTPAPFDGVIAVNPQVLSDILHITGALTVDGVRFDEKNTLDTIIESVEEGYKSRNTPFFRRKEILEKLSSTLIEKIKQFSADQLLSLIRRIPVYQQERVVQFYAVDPSTEKALIQLGWGGTVAPTSGDYLFVVDSNLAAYKTDSVMERSTDDHIVTHNGITDVELRLHYHHTKKIFDWKTTRYRTYTRVLVPAGATLLSSSGTLVNDILHNPQLKEYPIDVSTVEGKTQFGFFIAIEPGESRDVVVRYRLPSALTQPFTHDGYSLLVQHQSGVPARPLTVTVQSDTTRKPPAVIKRAGSVDELISIPRGN